VPPPRPSSPPAEPPPETPAPTGTQRRRLRTVLRVEDRVTPLELFFDLVFVLALTQCTALMAENPTWEGVAQAVLILGLLWWSWTGYAWLASVVDPEEGGVRIAIFAAMAAFLVAALSVPEAFGDLALTFALAYGVVRAAHIALMLLVGRDDPAFRRSTVGLGVGTAVGVSLVVVGTFFDGTAQAGIWALALLLDMAEPYFFGSEGWKVRPSHFAERHGLIIIIALGESIVAIGVGAGVNLDAGVIMAAVTGVAFLSAMWWLYFDVVALVAARRLARAEEGRVRNEMARDSYSYLHFPMVAGIVLVALGLKKTLGDVEDPLGTVPTFTLLGGLAIYLLAHVAFRYRHVHTINKQRLGLALVLLACVVLARELPALVVLGIVTAVLWVMIVYETISYGEARTRVRVQLATEDSS
jgi:low temperature requirement protein LtrA